MFSVEEEVEEGIPLVVVAVGAGVGPGKPIGRGAGVGPGTLDDTGAGVTSAANV